MNPKNWSAKAQIALAALVASVIVAALNWANKKFQLGMTEDHITTVGATGAAVVLGIAIIDNGEPAVAPAPIPESPEVTAAKKTLRDAGVTQL